jgi:hypothetical protein
LREGRAAEHQVNPFVSLLSEISYYLNSLNEVVSVNKNQKNLIKIMPTIFLVIFLIFQNMNGGAEEETMKSEKLLIDDFSKELSSFGTVWQGISDRVMGGVSDMEARILEDGYGRFLHLTGNVSLENNGGFIQARLFMNQKKKPYDASPYTGIALRVRGKGDAYYVYLRTPRTIFPWSFYGQCFKVAEQWTWAYLPFSSFRSENMLANKLNPSK